MLSGRAAIQGWRRDDGGLSVALVRLVVEQRSVRSPRVVDDKAPGSVGLTTQHIRVASRQRHRSTVWPGSRERPRPNNEGQIAGLKDSRHCEIERAFHRYEPGQPLANTP
jgi:hypothetical protein